MTDPIRLRGVTVSQYPPETTRLSPEEERLFQEWVIRRMIADANSPLSRYDYRGAFKAGIGSEISAVDNAPHWPDTFKQHGHPTFSSESKYSQGVGDGGVWQGADGETFVAPIKRRGGLKKLGSLPLSGVKDAVRR